MQSCKPQGLYYSIAVLNRLMFSEDDLDQVSQILQLYFQIFNKLKDEQAADTLGLLLKGISKVISSLDKTALETLIGVLTKDIESLFAMSHSSNFKIRVQTLTLLFQFIKIQEDLKDRFYKSLYELVGTLKEVSLYKLDDFFRLLFRSLRADENLDRVFAFLKRLLQACLCNDPSFIAACLLTINELYALKPTMKSYFKLSDLDEAQVYDPLKRDPRFAGIEPMYELGLLRRHFHPTV